MVIPRFCELVFIILNIFLKEKVSCDFCFRFFSFIIVLQAPDYNSRVISIFFSKIGVDIR